MLRFHKLASFRPLIRSCSSSILPQNAINTQNRLLFPTARTFASTPFVGGPEKDNANEFLEVVNTDQFVDSIDAITQHSPTIADTVGVIDGYSLSECAMRTLDVVHSVTGLPWWASIVCTTLVVRTMFFPVSVNSLRNSARMNMAKPHITKLQEEIKNDPKMWDPEVRMANSVKMKALYKMYQIKMFQPIILSLTQIPVFISFFWGLQEMGNIFPDFHDGGLLWFQNLAIADPLYVLPVLSSMTMLASVELGGEGMPEEYKDQIKLGMRCFSVILVPITMKFQSGVILYWISSNAFTVCQTLLMKNKNVKAALGIPEVSRGNLVSASSLTPFQAAVVNAKSKNTINTFANKPKKKKSTTKD